ncbi:hypothetical protein HPB50_001882 [Hyalomma asiaticum]|uniref:Uncharacterized protein n=1 Tax=Hyalomma asiaticum TaxID=266040 RepID=A0ACB7SUU8_HYAAI|nr:hypothetical protein HPB50_001882 [Hyalomma asiaticum]
MNDRIVGHAGTQTTGPYELTSGVADIFNDDMCIAAFEDCAFQGTFSNAALLARIKKLQRQLNISKAKARAKERDHKKLVSHLSSYISEDQFNCLHRSQRGTVWTKETLIRLSCSSRGYDMVKELGQPLPSQHTLQHHIEHCKFRPGLLTDVMDSFAIKATSMHGAVARRRQQPVPTTIRRGPTRRSLLKLLALAEQPIVSRARESHAAVAMKRPWGIAYNANGTCLNVPASRQRNAQGNARSRRSHPMTTVQG